MLFNEYPDNFFSVLFCRYQQLYADVLLRLYDLFYGRDAVAHPLRDEVKNTVAQVVEGYIEERGSAEWEDDLKGDEREMTELSLDAVAYRSHLIYKRLLDGGWIDEERDDDFRDLVSMPFYSAELLGVFKNAHSGRRTSYAGYVGNVYLQLKHLQENPQEASFLKQALESSEELLKKLQELYNSVKTFIRQTKDKSAVSDVIEQFFDRYMDRFFSGAYGKVKTVDNPFRYRHGIQKMLLEMRADNELVGKIARGYEGGSSAIADVIADLDAIEQIFSRLDDEISRIDGKREQYERIVKEQVRYFEGMEGDMKAIIAETLKMMSDDHVTLPDNLFCVKRLSFVDGSSLASPKTKAEAVRAQKVIRNEMEDDEYQIEFLKSMGRIASSVGTQQVMEYLNEIFAQRPETLGSELSVQSLKDLTCLLLSKYAAYESSRFTVDELMKEVENAYLKFQDFRIRRAAR